MTEIKTDRHDEYLSEIVPILIESASDFCSNTFDPEALPAGVKLFVAKAAEYNMNPSGLSGRSMGMCPIRTIQNFLGTSQNTLRHIEG